MDQGGRYILWAHLVGEVTLTPQELLAHLQAQTSRLLSLRINQNQKNVLSATLPTPESMRLSVHEMFLEAPGEVLDALVAFVQRKETKESRAALRRYIHGRVEEKREFPVTTRGLFYDLGKVYESVNEEYFGGELELGITWFGRVQRRRRVARLGEYCYGTKLVRIHRQLDSKRVPWQFLHFVVYHEMLHHVVPAHVSSSGRVYPHTEEFRRREREFAHFEWVKRWERRGWT